MRPFVTVLVGQSELLREGLTRILGAADFLIVASASCIDDLVATALPRQRPILLIIDAGDDLHAAVRQLEVFKERHPTGRIAVLANRNEPSDIIPVFRAGANLYFFKVEPCDALIKSLELVMLGKTILPPAILSMILDRRDDDDDGDNEHEVAVQRAGEAAGEDKEDGTGSMPRLSVRERCILNCLIEGASNKVIARKINIAEATVKVHIKAILRKTRVQNRTQAAIWAMSNRSSILAMNNGSTTPEIMARVIPATQRNELALLPVELCAKLPQLS